MFRKSLVVVLCTLTLLVGMAAFAAPAHAAALQPQSVIGGGSGGGCGGQPGPVRACIYIESTGNLIAYYQRLSWPSNCYQINIQIYSDSGWGPSRAFNCSVYQGVQNAGLPFPGHVYQAKATMYYSNGLNDARWSRPLCTYPESC
jgi:hypothetical protein